MQIGEYGNRWPSQGYPTPCMLLTANTGVPQFEIWLILPKRLMHLTQHASFVADCWYKQARARLPSDARRRLSRIEAQSFAAFLTSGVCC